MDLNPKIPPAVWRRLFDQPWAKPGEPQGRVLLHQERVVGYIALIRGRAIAPDGTEQPVVNVSTWSVHAAHRSQAMALIAPELTDPGLTLTNLTALPAVHDIFQRLGFHTLEREITSLWPIPWARSPWGRVAVATHLPDFQSDLTAQERRIASDHAGLAEHIFVREAGGSHCYALYTLGRRRKLRSAKIHWVSPQTFPEASISLRRALRQQKRAILVELDRRLARSRLPGEMVRPLEVPRLFRSPTLSVRDLSNAYSEMVLLNL